MQILFGEETAHKRDIPGEKRKSLYSKCSRSLQQDRVIETGSVVLKTQQTTISSFRLAVTGRNYM